MSQKTCKASDYTAWVNTQKNECMKAMTQTKKNSSQPTMSSGCRSQQQMRALLSSYINHQRPSSCENMACKYTLTTDNWELSICHATSACAGITQRILQPSGYQCCLTVHQRTQSISLTSSKPRSPRTCYQATPVTNRRSEFTCTQKHAWKRYQ